MIAICKKYKKAIVRSKCLVGVKFGIETGVKFVNNTKTVVQIIGNLTSRVRVEQGKKFIHTNTYLYLLALNLSKLQFDCAELVIMILQTILEAQVLKVQRY